MNLPWVEIKELPSKFLAYPKGSKILYRPFTYGEIVELAQSKLSDEEFARKILLPGIETRGFDKLDLVFADFSFITLLRYISSFPSYEFRISNKCYKCEKSINKSIRAVEIEYKDLEVPDLPIVANLSIGELHFMPLTLRNRIRLESDPDLDINNPKHVIASLIVNYNIHEAIKLLKLEDLLPEDVEIINEIDQMLALDIKPVSVKCSNENCGAINKIKLSIGGTLRPFRRHKKSVEDRVRFGISRDNKS